ncbi:MAG: hypothetical protein ACOYMR_00515 [Ilumatobacteraceae bacterium]
MALQVLATATGIVLVVAVLISALKTVVVPRGYASWLTRKHFRAWRWVFNQWAHGGRTYGERDRILSSYAPVALITLPAVWVALIGVGFTGIFWGTGVHPLSEALAISGSSLFTLGFDRPDTTWRVVVSFVEAGIGLGLVTLMISYLPTIYGAFSRREALVGMLEVRAGLPPSTAELLIRYQRIGWLDRLADDVFERWEQWFVDVEESHTSHPSLAFFRAPHPERSWITAAGCVLDTAAITASTLDLPRDARADVMIRTGFFTLRRIADYFRIDYPDEPGADHPITVTRQEFDELCADLAANGVPLKADLDQAWHDFRGWRVNYDATYRALCDLVHAPPGNWSR